MQYCALSCALLCLVAQSCLTLCDLTDCSPPGFSVHGDSPGKNTGVGGHALLQGIFLTQRAIPGLLHCRWILYRLSHQGSPCNIVLQFKLKSRLHGKKQNKIWHFRKKKTLHTLSIFGCRDDVENSALVRCTLSSSFQWQQGVVPVPSPVPLKELLTWSQGDTNQACCPWGWSLCC